jgi:hypothetical protein
VNGTGITQVPFNTDHTTTLADLPPQIQASTAVATAVASGANEITITGANDGAAVVVDEVVVAGGASQATGTVTVTQYEDTVLTNVGSLQAAQQQDDGWYAVSAYERTDAEILLIAAWVQTQRKIYGVSSNGSDIITSATDDLASDLKAASYDRTFLIYSADTAAYPEGGLLGKCLPLEPGSITWKFKNLSSITADDLTDTEKGYALAKNCNTYTTVGGQAIIEEGFMSGDEFIDVIRGIDWVYARMTENIYQAFITENKIPYTDNGVSVIVNRIQQILDQAVTRSIFTNDPAPTIDAPLVADVPVNDRANRTLPDVKWEAVLAGAIHKVIIRGTVTV